MDELPVSLALRSLGELGTRAARAAFTGDLVLREADGTEHRVVMRRGTIVDVCVAGRFDPLLAELHRTGDLNDADYVSVLEALGRSKRRAGDLARDVGASGDAITRALARQGAARMQSLRARARDRGREAFLSPREVTTREVRCRLDALPHLNQPRPPANPAKAANNKAAKASTPRQAQRRDQPYRPVPTAPRPPPRDRRALRRLAFELHPDRHPHLSDAERATMADQLRRATAAFHRL